MAVQPTTVIVVDDNPGFLKSVARLLDRARLHGPDIHFRGGAAG